MCAISTIIPSHTSSVRSLGECSRSGSGKRPRGESRVNTAVFSALADDATATRAELDLPDHAGFCYTLAVREGKNTSLLFRAFDRLSENAPEDFICCYWDGPERDHLDDLQARCPN